MAISLTIIAILAILLGILVLLFPRLVRWILGFYLIIYGILQIINIYL
ncbi:MAG: DUF3096 domain-containing protein [Candidatus Pacearchaeota archaeon]|nr:DUF3096 domain-containing protein [Candidatus Pacearchaeota archaeon]